MSIDLATFSSNVNSNAMQANLSRTFGAKGDLRKPPSIQDMRGMQYVDTYIKVYYFPQQVSLLVFNNRFMRKMQL